MVGDTPSTPKPSSNDTLVSSPSTCRDDNLPHPPSGYVPKGLFLFLSRGPFVENRKLCINFFALEHSLENRSHTNSRKKKADEKALKRDYKLGAGKGNDRQRGLALGAANQKNVALVVQQQAQRERQAFKGEIVCLNMLLELLQSQVQTSMEMTKMYQLIGDTSKMTELLSAAKTLVDEMEDKRTSLSKLKAIK